MALFLLHFVIIYFDARIKFRLVDLDTTAVLVPVASFFDSFNIEIAEWVFTTKGDCNNWLDTRTFVQDCSVYMIVDICVPSLFWDSKVINLYQLDFSSSAMASALTTFMKHVGVSVKVSQQNFIEFRN